MIPVEMKSTSGVGRIAALFGGFHFPKLSYHLLSAVRCSIRLEGQLKKTWAAGNLMRLVLEPSSISILNLT